MGGNLGLREAFCRQSGDIKLGDVFAVLWGSVPSRVRTLSQLGTRGTCTRGRHLPR